LNVTFLIPLDPRVAIHTELFPRDCEETTFMRGEVELVFGTKGSVQFLSVYPFQPSSPSHEVIAVSAPSALANLTVLERDNAMAMAVAENFILRYLFARFAVNALNNVDEEKIA
jgi:hypothetical protein